MRSRPREWHVPRPCDKRELGMLEKLKEGRIQGTGWGGVAGIVQSGSRSTKNKPIRINK